MTSEAGQREAEPSGATLGCCAGGELYRDDAVRALLGDVWHPGGLGLTRRLASLLKIGESDLVLDAACGVGSSSILLSQESGCATVGIDLLPQNVKEAVGRTGVSHTRAAFMAAEAHHIPLASSSLNVALLECVLSAMDDKARAVEELGRVLKPGGRLGITDIVVEGELPQELSSPALQSFCIGGALSQEEYVELVERSGFRVLLSEREAASDILAFLEEIRRKLFVAKLLVGVRKLKIDERDLDNAKALLSSAKEAVADGRLGYCVIVARNEAARQPTADGERGATAVNAL